MTVTIPEDVFRAALAYCAVAVTAERRDPIKLKHCRWIVQMVADGRIVVAHDNMNG